MSGIAWVLRAAVHTPDRFATDAATERARLVTLRDELRRSIR